MLIATTCDELRPLALSADAASGVASIAFRSDCISSSLASGSRRHDLAQRIVTPMGRDPEGLGVKPRAGSGGAGCAKSANELANAHALVSKIAVLETGMSRSMLKLGERALRDMEVTRPF